MRSISLARRDGECMKLLQRITRTDLAFFFCCCLVVAFVYSKFALSLSMIGLLATGLFDWHSSRVFPLRLRTGLSDHFHALVQNKAFAVIPLYFFIVLSGVFYSDDWSYLIERLRIRLPFLVLPVAFICLPPFPKRYYEGIRYFFLLFMFVASIAIGLRYWLDYELITEMIGRGKPIPTPVNHIRFSLALAFSIVSGATLYRSGFYVRYPFERGLIAGILVFLFLFIHLLSVRSGLIALYICMAYYLFRYVWMTRRYLVGTVALIALVMLPVVAYHTIPAFRTKYDYMVWDWRNYRKGNGNLYSDSDRFLSVKVGLRIGNEHPLAGIGPGDVKREVENIYFRDYKHITEAKMPHNQFVSVYAGSGLIGLAAFLFAFFTPLLYRRHYRDPLFTALHIIVFCSFLTESTIETSVGTAFYIFFLLLGLNYLRNQEV